MMKSMQNKLIPYDQTQYPFEILTQLTPTEESIFISYSLSGDIAQIDLEDGTPKRERIIGLWQKTCFELFIKNNKDQYIEFNFSPVFEWNCFFFNKKGDPLCEFPLMKEVKFDILRSAEVFKVIVEIDRKSFPENFFDGEMLAGITTVIKEKSAKVSYWALSHNDTRPNFHHFESFKCKF